MKFLALHRAQGARRLTPGDPDGWYRGKWSGDYYEKRGLRFYDVAGSHAFTFGMGVTPMDRTNGSYEEVEDPR